MLNQQKAIKQITNNKTNNKSNYNHKRYLVYDEKLSNTSEKKKTSSKENFRYH